MVEDVNGEVLPNPLNLRMLLEDGSSTILQRALLPRPRSSGANARYNAARTSSWTPITGVISTVTLRPDRQPPKWYVCARGAASSSSGRRPRRARLEIVAGSEGSPQDQLRAVERD